MAVVEFGLREAIMKDGRSVMEWLYEQAPSSAPGHARRPGEKCHVDRPKEVETLFGPITLRRDYFYSEETDLGRAPVDEALGLINGFSPALVRLVCRAAARLGYAQAGQDLAALANIHIEGRQIQRLVNLAAPLVAAQRAQLKVLPQPNTAPIAFLYIEADGTGVPMLAAELEGRKGKQPDGSAKTREVKIGCVFTQTTTDDEGLPMRDHESTSYIGSFDSAQEFGALLRAEAIRRGLGRALQVVFLGDGAAWIWELVRVNFPDAIQILDLYHALVHLHLLCQGLFGAGTTTAEHMEELWTNQFKQDQVKAVIAEARRQLDRLPPQQDNNLEKQIAYFENHQDRMLYLTYRNQGIFYGSGVIEAGCKIVVGQRLKQSGMFWSEPGAQSILNLRCTLLSNLWDWCWDRIQSTQPKAA
jgi:hypothetical protein